ncbi:MAG: FAD-dependent oxidoreductase [Akkermansia sp.]
MKTSDFLVIGAGVAGLSFALRAAEHGKVAVITKGNSGLQFRQGTGRHRRRMGPQRFL